MGEKIFTGFLITFCFVLIVSILSVIFIGPVYEKNSYTKLTGVEVTYWDAFFMELDPSKHIVMLQDKK